MKLMNLLGVGRVQPSQQGKPTASAPVESMLCRDPRANKMLQTGGYCKLLQQVGEWRNDAVLAATHLLETKMSFVPAGALEMQGIVIGKAPWEDGGTTKLLESPFFIDRNLVTNEEYKHFLNVDAYRTETMWPTEIWPMVSQFIDSTGVPGPAGWEGGNFPEGKADHPVVGISWHEANAYANWLGKALPTSSQWQRAGTWCRPRQRFPWGDNFERKRINTYGVGGDDTVSVSASPASGTKHGVLQLVGNVWEWVESTIDNVAFEDQVLELAEPLGEIRGGAFDTYLPSQSTCLFRSGQTLASRKKNVGFRCAASYELLAIITSD